MTIEEQVTNLTKRVYALELEVEKLKNPEKVQDTVSEPVEKALVPCVEPVITSGPNRFAAVVPPITPGVMNTTENVPRRKQDGRVERAIGAKIMPAIASVLIVVSLVLFAIMYNEKIGDFIKVATMFLVSGIFTVVGLFGHWKNKKNYVFDAFAGCGIAGIYISLCVTGLIFGFFSPIVLIVSLAVWTLLVAVLSKISTPLFGYIVSFGVVASLFVISHAGLGWIWAVSFLTGGILAAYLVNRKGKIASDWIYPASFEIGVWIFVLLFDKDGFVMIGATAAAFVVALLVALLYDLTEGKKVWAVLSTLVSVFTLFSIMFSSKLDLRLGLDLAGLYYFAAMLCLGCAFFFRYYKTRPCVFYIVMYAFALTGVPAMMTSLLPEWIGCALVFVPLVVLGYVLSDRNIKYSGLFLLLHSMWIADSKWDNALVYITVAAVLVFMLVYARAKFSIENRLTVAFGFIFFIWAMGARGLFNLPVAFVFLSIVSVVMNMAFFATDSKTGKVKKPLLIAGYVFNFLMMVVGTLLVRFNDSDIFFVKRIENSSTLSGLLIALATIVLYSINTVELFSLNISEMLAGVYLCGKFTVLAAALLEAVDAAGFVISIVGLVIATICIVLGFTMRRKSFRGYGLVLSLICVVKLLIVDISYKVVFMKPMSYFIAGVICFAIAIVYTKLEKKEKEES